MNKKGKKIVLNLLIVFFVILFCVSAFVLVKYIADSKKQKAQFDDIASLVEKPKPTKPSAPAKPRDPDAAEPTEDPYPGCVMVTDPRTQEKVPVLPEYEKLFLENPDVIGWMKLEGTPINYPVMQTPDRKDFYLRKDFYGEYSSHGCLYARGACDVFRPSDNVTIYGHNMRDGSMFAALHDYQRKGFWEEHPVIQFDTIRSHNEYEVFAVFKTTANEKQGFPYHLFVDAQNDAQFNRFVKNCKSMSFYDTGITPRPGDKLICLSTCDYSISDGRLIVAARMIPDYVQE